eukprot:scaffold220365_cov28-Tisochrysis_lutea.AAC.1
MRDARVNVDLALELHDQLHRSELYGNEALQALQISGLGQLGAKHVTPSGPPGSPLAEGRPVSRPPSPSKKISRAGSLHNVGSTALSPRVHLQTPRHVERDPVLLIAGPLSPRARSRMLPSLSRKSREAGVEAIPSEVSQLLADLYGGKGMPIPPASQLSPPRSSRGTPRSRQSFEDVTGHFKMSKERVISRLQKLSCFRRLSEAELGELLQRARHKWHERYSYVAREGAICSGMTVILEGTVELSSQSHSMKAEHAQPGFALGQATMVTRHAIRHEHTVQALSEAYSVTWSHEEFDGFRLAISPSERNEAHARILGSIPFFFNVAPEKRVKISALLEMQQLRVSLSYPEPTPVVSEGEKGAPFYFLVEGTIALHCQSESNIGKRLLANIEPDSKCPWFGSITSQGAPASAVVVTDTCLCLVLKPDKLTAFLKEVPEFVEAVQVASTEMTSDGA